MMSEFSKPTKIDPSEIRTRIETADGGFKVGFLVDASSHGSPLLLGLEWLESGGEGSEWEADAETHETYYVQQGELRITWDGEESGEVVLEPGDSFYFPPSYRYSAENVGSDQVFVIWSLVPSPHPEIYDRSAGATTEGTP
jgi:mannose-6-phosphate isomerase-like protein (cupin superfamily)